MADTLKRYTSVPTSAQGGSVAYDEGLRAYMLGIYNYMAGGVAVTGLIAYLMAQVAGPGTSLGMTLYGSPLAFVIMLAPLAMVFFMSFRAHKMSLGATQASFWVFAALMGLSLATIFMVYTDASIARVFFMSAATFGAMSLWGYTTKQDLTSWGSFLFMGLIGIIIASVVNIFVGSSAIDWVVSVLGVLIFVGFTAYDTQKLKEMYDVVSSDAVAMGKASVMGALTLYLDFINIFLSLLRLFGDRE